MGELAVFSSPGPFKAKKDPERMLADFNLYVKTMKHLLVIRQQHSLGRQEEGSHTVSVRPRHDLAV